MSLSKSTLLKMTKSELIKKVWSLDYKRRAAWKSYYEELEYANECATRLHKLCKSLKTDADIDTTFLKKQLLELIKKYEDGKNDCPICM